MTTASRPPKDTQKLHAVDAAEDADIRPTDILFNCPHCGHSLCIDCRGAGLLTNCTECSKEILVPIPEGMNVEDLDLTKDQTIGQLFYTRRMLARAEQRISELEEVIASLKERRSAMEKTRMTTLHHCADISNLCQSIQRSQGETAATLNRMLEIIASEQQH
jgi:predicted RNA-binding Zn-ribbon protein involved in translation (DUF1610 family)